MTDAAHSQHKRPIKAPFQAADEPLSISAPPDWTPFEDAPRDGTFIRATADIESGYAIIRWKRTRIMVCNRWVPDGHWVDELNRKIGFEPLYFQPRHGAI